MSGLSAALTKLIEVIDEENAFLKDHRVVLHAGFTDRKNQALRELMAAQRSENSEDTARLYKVPLQRLSSALQTNTALLKLNISAVGEISDIIIGGLRDAQSDGTYSRNRQSGV